MNPSHTNGPKGPKNDSISFQPVNQGLGFHPFSDGLPYAPVGKTPRSNSPSQTIGLGAMAAGPARVVRPHVPERPRPPTPSSAPTQTPLPQNNSIQTPPGQVAKAPALGFGYLFKRMLAYITDLLWTVILMGLAMSSWIWKPEGGFDLSFSPSTWVTLILLFLGSQWSVVTLQEVIWKTTIGKRLFGLRLQGPPAFIFLRAILFIPSACLLGGGLLWSLFDRRKRCWHDQAVGIQPIEVVRF